MREDLNAILALIGATSLTDEEFNSLTIEDLSDDQATYDDLDAVLVSRESVSTERDRLQSYYEAKGLTFGEPPQGQSNIYLGDVLE